MGYPVCVACQEEGRKRGCRVCRPQFRPGVPTRNVTEVGKGDLVKIGQDWKRIHTNSAAGAERVPRNWTITTADGSTYDMYGINRYAKWEDLE